MLVYLVLTRTLLMSEHLDPRRLARTFWDERRLWLPYFVIVFLWGIGYVASGAYSTAHHGSVSFSEYLDYFRIMWVNALVPAVAGIVVPASGLSSLQTVAVVALQLAVVALLVISVRRKPSAWRAWAFILIACVLEGGVVAQARVPVFGVGIAGDIRYLTDFPWLVPFAMCCAFSRDRVLRPRPVADRTTVRPSRRATVVALAGGALLVAYGGAALATAEHLQARWGSVDARKWGATLRQSFGALARRHIRPVVADGVLPFRIIGAEFAPDNRFSRVLPLYVPGAKVDGPINGPLATVDGGGHVHLARVRQAIGGASLHVLQAGRPVVPDGGPAGRAGVCVAAGSSAAELEQTLPARLTGPGPFYLVLRYSASQPLLLGVLADSGAGYSGAYQDKAIVTPAARTSLTLIAGGPPKRITLVVPAHAALCVQRIDVVDLAAS